MFRSFGALVVWGYRFGNKDYATPLLKNIGNQVHYYNFDVQTSAVGA